MIAYEELVSRRRELRIEPYATLADVGCDGPWITPFHITSCCDSGPVLVAFHWLDRPSIERYRSTLMRYGYLPGIRFNDVLDMALRACGLSRNEIYVTQAFHLIPEGRSQQITKKALDQSFDQITRHELAGRTVVALGAVASNLCTRHGIVHEAACHPSRRGFDNESNAADIAQAISRLGLSARIRSQFAEPVALIAGPNSEQRPSRTSGLELDVRHTILIRPIDSDKLIPLS